MKDSIDSKICNLIATLQFRAERGYSQSYR